MKNHKYLLNGRLASLLILPAIVALSVAATVATKSDFSGEWTLNSEKSALGEFGGRMASSKLKVTQKDNALTIERTGTNRNGETFTVTDNVSLDGKETEGKGWGNSTRKLSATLTADGLTINGTTVFSRDGNTFEIKTTESWKKSGDGKILTIDVTSTSTRGTNNMTLVYDKVN